jgi:pyruvate dehydrogenase E2 component (dihydrolipoamide acetyltransferase)
LAFEFKFPDVGEGIVEGEVVKWHVKEGDRVEEDQVLLEVETDKAVVEIPSPTSGYILKILVDEGDIINVGQVMVVIGEEKEEVSVDATPKQKPADKPRETSKSGSKAKAAAAPATRKLARELGIELAAIHGTGPGGRITPDDVRNATSRKAEPVGKTVKKKIDLKVEETVERVKMRGVRKKVSEAMLTSIKNIPHVTHVDEVDVSRLIQLRESLNKRWSKGGFKLSFLPFFIKAVALNLRDFPAMNASVDEETDEIVYKKYYNIGMATATPDGLIVPVIKYADRLSLIELSKEIERLAEATRSRKVPLDDLKGATFSVTNYGSIGGLLGTPIIHHPETAILGIGKFFDKLVLSGDTVEQRDFVYLSLSFDHRVADGADSARFVNSVKSYLEEPETYFMELI